MITERPFCRRGFVKAALAAGVSIWLPKTDAGILLLRAVTPPTPPGPLPTTGLLGHWPLTLAAQVTDTSGNGNNGTPHNNFGDTSVSDHNGVAGGALVCNPIGTEYATFPNLWTTDWTVALWVKCDADSPAYNRIIGQTNYLTDLALLVASGINQPNCYDGSWHVIGTVGTGWTVGQWHHIAITRNHTGPVGEFFFDGSPNNATTVPNFTTTIYLGADYQGLSAGNIAVSQMVLYNRVLSNSEVTDVYTNT